MVRWYQSDNLKREVPTPEPDGTITVFNTSRTFKPGTLVVIVNGVTNSPINPISGYLEFGNQSFVMHMAPRIDDTLEVLYEAK